MKFLIALALATRAAADFEVSRKVLPPRALSGLLAKIRGGASHVEADAALGALLGVSEGALVPGKVSRGAVREHQDTFSDAAAVKKVSLLYLGHGSGTDKFVLRDTRTGAEHAVDLDEPGLFVSYENEFFTHRVEARESSERVMLGPASLRDGVLAPVGENCLQCPSNTERPDGASGDALDARQRHRLDDGTVDYECELGRGESSRISEGQGRLPVCCSNSNQCSRFTDNDPFDAVCEPCNAGACDIVSIPVSLPIRKLLAVEAETYEPTSVTPAPTTLTYGPTTETYAPTTGDCLGGSPGDFGVVGLSAADAVANVNVLLDAASILAGRDRCCASLVDLKGPSGSVILAGPKNNCDSRRLAEEAESTGYLRGAAAFFAAAVTGARRLQAPPEVVTVVATTGKGTNFQAIIDKASCDEIKTAIDAAALANNVPELVTPVISSKPECQPQLLQTEGPTASPSAGLTPSPSAAPTHSPSAALTPEPSPAPTPQPIGIQGLCYCPDGRRWCSDDGGYCGTVPTDDAPSECDRSEL